MFKWKVSGLGSVGGSSKKNKSTSVGTKLNNGSSTNPLPPPASSNITPSQNNNNNVHANGADPSLILDSHKNNKNKELQERQRINKDSEASVKQESNKNVGDDQSSHQRTGGIRSFFGVGGGSNSASNLLSGPSNHHQQQQQQQQARSSSNLLNPKTSSQNVDSNQQQQQHHPASRIGSRLANMSDHRNSRLHLSTEHIYSASGQIWRNNGESSGGVTQGGGDALPSDSLYGTEDVMKRSSNASNNNNSNNNSYGPKGTLPHWSSHGYLSKGESEAHPPPSLAPFKKPQQQTQPPLSLPPHGALNAGEGERKYFSVRGLSDMRNKHSVSNAHLPNDAAPMDKYYSVDARYHSDLRAKIKDQQRLQQQPPYPAPPPPPPAKSDKQQQQPQPSNSSLTSSKALGGSVSWLEWTQQLQAYVAWVNSQLRKRPDLRPVTDLRTDLQSGEVLAQLIDIIAGEKIAGIQYNPESLQGMRENLERILQFMHSKRIRMHQITSKEILEGNLKAVMRLILALAAHYKPQSVRHHEQNSGNGGSNNSNGGKEEATEEASGVSKNNVKSFKGSMQNSGTPLSTGTDSPLNTTQDSISEVHPSSSSGIKRTPSLNESYISHSSKDRLGPEPEPSTIYENLSSSTETEKLIVEEAMASAMTQTEAESPLRRREGSFVRTGSGRKLPKIPQDNTASTANMMMAAAASSQDPQKSKPKALEFWESIEDTIGDRGDFRYNTIHRMSMGRRILPKPPPPSNAPSSVRSHSLDRSTASRHYHQHNHEEMDSMDYKKDEFESPSPRKKIPADGCSLQSGGSSADGTTTTQEESVSSASSRGEVEGSSDHHASPPTSVIGNGESSWVSGTAYQRQGSKWSGQEYLKELSSDKYSPKYPCRTGDGRVSACSSSSLDGQSIPYDILLQDLTQAKRQLMELHSLDNAPPSYSKQQLQSSSSSYNRNNECPDIKSLKQNLVRTTLVKQNLEFEKSDLIRKIEELEKEVNGVRSDVSEKEKIIQKLTHKNNGSIISDHQLKAFYDEELVFAKDAISNLRTSFNEADPNQHILDTLEQCISVIIEKIQNLDGCNNNNNHVGSPVIPEKNPIPSNHRSQQSSHRKNSILKPSNDGSSLKVTSHSQNLNNTNNNPTFSTTKNIPSIITSHPPSTKILYFTNKSVTPFMSTVPKRIGDIVLRDFKNIFDRPGFYRYHFKTLDQEFGMVKEEISDDDMPLPGTDGKIVVWVEED